MKNHRKKRILAGVMAGAMAFTMASCQIEGQEPTNVNTTSISSTETTTNPDLKDVAPERLEFTKDFLNLYDESSTDASSGDFKNAFNKIKDFISRDQIIKYGETGETGENLSIIKHKDGNPAVALINCNDNVTNVFNAMVNNMNKYDPDFLKKMTNNGMIAFMVNRYNPNIGGSFTFNESGLIVWNLKPESVNLLIGSGGLERPVMTETFGIKLYSLGGDYARYIGFLKEQLSSDCWWNLYKKTGDEKCKQRSYSNYVFCKSYYNQFYSPINFQDEEIQGLLKNIRNENLIIPFGGDWSEIKSSISDRPDWNLGDIK